MSQHDQGDRPPSLADIAAALKTLNQPDPGGLTKGVTSIIVAAAIGIGAWLLTGLNSMQRTVTEVSATLAAVQRDVSAMTLDSRSGAVQQGELKTSVARLEQRVMQNERKIEALEGRGGPNVYQSPPSHKGTEGGGSDNATSRF